LLEQPVVLLLLVQTLFNGMPGLEYMQITIRDVQKLPELRATQAYKIPAREKIEGPIG
jgi:hypothetical protein